MNAQNPLFRLPKTHLFPFDWKLSDGYPAKGISLRDLSVYSTFSCGGGSTMGYKLAGFNMIGANDIDPQMQKLYIANHHPKRYDLCPVTELLTKELPQEMFELDILDGSPPCSTFSMCGDREKSFGKKKKFREGQAEQVLSDLFFEFIKLTDRFKPKVAVAENVRGMLVGNAKSYTYRVIEEFKAIGYDVQLFLLNSALMGICQKRERVFFVARRRDLNLPEIKLQFNEEIVTFEDIDEGDVKRKPIHNCDIELWKKIRPGQNYGKAHPKGHRFNSQKLDYNRPMNTIAASDGSCFYHPKFPGFITESEMIKAGSFPSDYDFCGMKPQYTIGMSVPPVMMAHVANQIAIQIFNK